MEGGRDRGEGNIMSPPLLIYVSMPFSMQGIHSIGKAAMAGGIDGGADTLMSPPSEAEAMAVGLEGGEDAASPRVDLAYEPRYQR